MHSIEFDEQLVLVRVKLKGYWTLAEHSAFEAELSALVQEIAKRHRHFRLLSDGREFAVQSPEITGAMAEAFVRVAKDNRGATAIVAGSVLAKMQVERVMPFPHVRGFLDIEQAQAWVLGEGTLPQEEE